jgi:hypothetical protein
LTEADRAGEARSDSGLVDGFIDLDEVFLESFQAELSRKKEIRNNNSKNNKVIEECVASVGRPKKERKRTVRPEDRAEEGLLGVEVEDETEPKKGGRGREVRSITSKERTALPVSPPLSRTSTPLAP